MGMSPGDIDGILLTHFHSDHIDGLGEMLLQRWATGGHVRPTPVYGSTGVEQVVAGFNQAYAQDSFYRVAHHGEQTMPLSGRGATAEGFMTSGVDASVVVLEQGDLRVTAFTVDHQPVSLAVGYRFDYKDRSLVVSGDTSKSVNLEEFAAGVDLLVHEALSPSLLLLLNQAAREMQAEAILRR
jgi:ribonuclease Z